MMAHGVFLVAFGIYFEGKQPQKTRGILGFISMRENDQKSRPSPHVHTCQATSD
jgi:hypothetical protein